MFAIARQIWAKPAASPVEVFERALAADQLSDFGPSSYFKGQQDLSADPNERAIDELIEAAIRVGAQTVAQPLWPEFVEWQALAGEAREWSRNPAYPDVGWRRTPPKRRRSNLFRWSLNRSVSAQD